jgi:hypothetical protein
VFATPTLSTTSIMPVAQRKLSSANASPKSSICESSRDLPSASSAAGTSQPSGTGPYSPVFVSNVK